jgi:hypothetical protein
MGMDRIGLACAFLRMGISYEIEITRFPTLLSSLFESISRQTTCLVSPAQILHRDAPLNNTQKDLFSW